MTSLNFRTKHLLIIVLALIAGICLASHIAWSMIIFCAILCLIFNEKQAAFIFTLSCCFFFFGAMRYHQNREIYFSDNSYLYKKCNVTATIQEIMPRLDEEEQICIILNIEQIEFVDKAVSVNKKIYLFLPYYTTLWIKPFQKIMLKNIILKHPESLSYQEYLIRENVWAVTHQKKLWYETISKPTLFQQQINALYLLPLSTTQHAFSELTHTLYLSIFCGKKIKSIETTSIKKIFQYWGISHQLARSGLHLVILISLLSLLFSFVPCSASNKQLLILSLLVIYYLTTYSSVAFMRAFYMYIFYVACKHFYLPSNSVHILLVTALLILSLNPHHIFFLDFQLSFGITLLILWFCQKTQISKTIAS